MQFLITNDLDKTPFLKYLMVMLTFFVVLFVALDIALHHYHIGLTVESAMQTLHGNEEAFIEPILFPALLLQVHIDLFLSMFVLLLLAAMYIRLYTKAESTYLWVHFLFITAFLSSLLLLINYFYPYPAGMLAWIILFYIWHVIALYLSFKIWYKLL